jgi:hypothetical protein
LYSGFSVGKNALSLLGNSPSDYVANSTFLTNSEVAQNISTSQKQMDAFIAATEQYALEGYSYEKGVALAAKDAGISNWDDAIADYNITEEQLRGHYGRITSGEAGRKEQERKDLLDTFLKDTHSYWDYDAGTNGLFQTAMWLPFFGNNQKYDTRMDAVDSALTEIQGRIGSRDNHTVISGLEEISRKLGDDTEYTVLGVLTEMNTNINDTFVSTSSAFQKCLADWIRYITESEDYTNTVSKSQAWSDFKSAERDQQTEATLALANALQVFSAEELQKMDPQLQTNALLGEIVIILQAIMQQTNTPGGLNLIDTISALGLGMTK